jgi:hypothetical protein
VRTALLELDDALHRPHEDLETTLADKAAALTTAEEQLWQERAARQGAEG